MPASRCLVPLWNSPIIVAIEIGVLFYKDSKLNRACKLLALYSLQDMCIRSLTTLFPLTWETRTLVFFHVNDIHRSRYSSNWVLVPLNGPPGQGYGKLRKNSTYTVHRPGRLLPWYCLCHWHWSSEEMDWGSRGVRGNRCRQGHSCNSCPPASMLKN